MTQKYIPKFESTLAAKLRGVRKEIKTKTEIKDPNLDLPALPSAMSRGQDGHGHINIWQFGETTLGVAMSHYSRLAINHPNYGKFASVDGFWQWVISCENDDHLRTATGKLLRTLARKITHRRIPNLRMIIMEACWFKVQQHSDLAKAIKTSTLPFDCYYHEAKNKQLRIRPYYAIWMIYGFEEIRKALNEKREPSFEKLRESGEHYSDIYAPVNAIIFPPQSDDIEIDKDDTNVEESINQPPIVDASVIVDRA